MTQQQAPERFVSAHSYRKYQRPENYAFQFYGREGWRDQWARQLAWKVVHEGLAGEESHGRYMNLAGFQSNA